MADQVAEDKVRADPSRPIGGRRFLIFRVDGRLYALPGEDAVEIILIPPVARLPHSPKSLMGLINLRGTVLPLVDLRFLLGRGSFVPGGMSRAIVCSGPGASKAGGHGEPKVAVAVDRVDAFLMLDGAAIETRQAELVTEAGERLSGALRLHANQNGPDRNGSNQNGADQGVAKILDLPAMLTSAFGARVSPVSRIRAEPIPDAAVKTIDDSHLLVSFAVGGQDYALALNAVREIVQLPGTITRVPRTEAVLLGVISWRDTLLPLLSLRGLLGFAAGEMFDGGEKVIVMPVGGVLVGLVADRMRAIIRANPDQIDVAPAMLAARAGGEARISAIYRGDDGRHLVSVLAPEHLFREDVMRRLGDSTVSTASASTVQLPEETRNTGGHVLRFVIFHLAEEAYALPIGAVDEVARAPEQITRVPKTPEFLAGVINLRGDVLPVVDQRRRFDLPPFEGKDVRRLIVVRTERHRAGLIVDNVSEVLRVPADAIEAAPDLSHDERKDSARLIAGVINEPATAERPAGRIILLLDPSELLTRAERGILDKMELATNGSGSSGQDTL
jgi:purine-binding chemotaxis protein CheW